MQLDRLVQPAGIFNPARTFSLVRDDAGLYLIFTGRAMGNLPPGGGVAGVAAGAILGAIADKRTAGIAQVEAELRAQGPAALKDTKHSRLIPRAQVKAVTISGGSPPQGWPIVLIVADKKFKLHCHAYDAATVREFFAPYLATGPA